MSEGNGKNNSLADLRQLSLDGIDTVVLRLSHALRPRPRHPHL